MTKPVRLALVGVGNCASALIQGLTYYGQEEGPETAGLMSPLVGQYCVADIEVVAAFDVSAVKVGRDVADAIFAEPNNTLRFADPPRTGVIVKSGLQLDGLSEGVRALVPTPRFGEKVDAENIRQVLTESGATILVNYLPVGSEKAARVYCRAALDCGISVLNCIPVFLANDPTWVDYARRSGAILAGDDIKSQYGATIVHQHLAALLTERGLRLDRTYQLNFGGNTDFLNMLESSRLVTKRISKTRAVTDAAGIDLDPDNVHIGPSDYVPWLHDRKVAYIRLEATAFGGAPLSLEVRLDVWDSPNSAGVVIDAVRAIQVQADTGAYGLLRNAAAYFKAPGKEAVSEPVAKGAE